MNFVNLCGHEITIVRKSGAVQVIPKGTGTPCRVATSRVAGPSIPVDGDEIETSSPNFGEVTGLPDPTDGVVYLVSGIVAGRVKVRPDVFSPGELVRDAAGQPCGCKGLTISGG